MGNSFCTVFDLPCKHKVSWFSDLARPFSYARFSIGGNCFENRIFLITIPFLCIYLNSAWILFLLNCMNRDNVLLYFSGLKMKCFYNKNLLKSLVSYLTLLFFMQWFWLFNLKCTFFLLTEFILNLTYFFFILSEIWR